MPDSSTPIEVFYSYAHKDETFRNKLETHLSLLRRQGLITEWHDRHILPGADWSQAIDDHLEHASVILLLISADFLASDYSFGIEMQRALERHQANEARVIPILLRPVDWDNAPFAHLQALPTGAKPITTWRNRDAAFTDVAAGIRRVIEELPSLAASAPRAALPSIWNVPYPRNSFFIGRDVILTRLRTQLQTGQAIALSQPQAIIGLGGIGKTQLAVEYAYRFHQDYQVVLWARAESTEALTSSYITIATLLNLPEKEAQEQEITVQAIKTWLQTHSGWLLIMDNADDLNLLPAFLPPALGGHLLLTTRAFAVGRLASRLEVDTLADEQGALFLLRRAALMAPDATLEQVSPKIRDLAIQVSQELGGLPLALDQAGAYLEATGTSLAAYQQIYQQHRTDLLAQRRAQGADHPEPVASTWSLSFTRVEETNPAAADLLRLCAYLAPDTIPEEIVTQGAEHLGPVLGPVASDAFLFGQAIEALRAYSLIGRNPSLQTLSVHRLVQAVMRDALDASDMQRWVERAIRAVHTVLPPVEHANWPEWERLLAHALACASWMDPQEIHLQEAAEVQEQAGWYLTERARYSEAEPLLERAYQMNEQEQGAEHLNTVRAASTLAYLYYAQGRYELAEPLYEHAMAIYEQQLGPEHPDTATSLNNLAELYQAQGRYELAEPLYQRALAIREQQLGPEHPLTASSIDNLAELYREQGGYEQAEPLYQRALAIREQQLGPEHPDTAISLNNLAALYQTQGKYEQAEPLYQRALTISEQQLGPLHPGTATSLSNLAALYQAQGKYKQAEPLLVRAMAIWEQQLGPQHPDTATSLNNLAGLYQAQGKYEQAEPLLERAMAIYEQQLGPEHPSTAGSLINLAELYQAQGKYEQAEPLLVRALAIYEQQLGPEHPGTAISLNNLAGLYKAQGKYEQAELLYQRSLAIREQQLGPEHPGTATGLNNLALLYHRQGKYEQAEPLFVRALAIREQQLGPVHPDTAQSQDNLAGLYRAQGKYEQAEPLLVRALSIREEQLGPEHPGTAISLNNLAHLYYAQGKYEQAEPLLVRALSIREQQLGPEHPDTAISRGNYVALLLAMGRDAEARTVETKRMPPS
jgi:tetratricopeptide (TPR) repeat protein